MTDPTTTIGTLRETPLHASLKRWYAIAGDRIEVPVDGFVIDLVRDDLLIEVQTSGFASMKKKVMELIGLGHPVRIVHPVAAEKWIVKIDGDGEVLSRRRSPKRGSPADVFAELVSFPELIENPLVEIDVLLTAEEEYRRHSPDGPWRRRGWSVVERRLVSVVDLVAVSGASDLLDLLPEDLPGVFTTAELAAAMGRPRRLAQQAAYCLRSCGAIEAVGKRGNAVEYRIPQP